MGWKLRKDSKGLLAHNRHSRNRNKDKKRVGKNRNQKSNNNTSQSDEDDMNLNWFNLYAKKFVLEKRWRGIDYPLDGIGGTDQGLSVKDEIKTMPKGGRKGKKGNVDSSESEDESSSEEEEQEESVEIEEESMEEDEERRDPEPSSEEDEEDEDEEMETHSPASISSDADQGDDILTTKKKKNLVDLSSKRGKKALEKFKPKSYYLEGHHDSIYCMRFDNGIYSNNFDPSLTNPNSKVDDQTGSNPDSGHLISYPKIVSGSRDHTIKIWDQTTLECKHTLRGHTASVLCLQYDDEILVSGGSDKTVLIWDFSMFGSKNKKKKRSIGKDQSLIDDVDSAIELRKNNKISNQKVEEEDVDRGEKVVEEEEKPKVMTRLTYHKEGVLDIAFNSNYIVSCSKDSQVCVWSRNRDDNPLFSSKPKTYEEYDTTEGEDSYDQSTSSILSQDPKDKGSQSSKVIDTNNTSLYTKSSSTSTLKPITLNYVYSTHSGPVNAISLFKNHIVSASGDNFMYLWKLENGENKTEFKGHKRGLACIDYENGKIVTGSNDRIVKVWNGNGECLFDLKKHKELVRTVRFDGGKRILSGGYDRRVMVWNLDQVQNQHQNQIESDDDRPLFDSDGDDDSDVDSERSSIAKPTKVSKPIQSDKPSLNLKTKARRVFDVHFDSRKIYCCGEDSRIEIKDFSFDLGEDVELFD